MLGTQPFTKTNMSGGYLCNAVPGHSTCKGRINKGNCPSAYGDMTDTMCHGHSHNGAADIPAAKHAIGAKKATKEQVVLSGSTPMPDEDPAEPAEQIRL